MCELSAVTPNCSKYDYIFSLNSNSEAYKKKKKKDLYANTCTYMYMLLNLSTYALFILQKYAFKVHHLYVQNQVD